MRSVFLWGMMGFLLLAMPTVGAKEPKSTTQNLEPFDTCRAKKVKPDNMGLCVKQELQKRNKPTHSQAQTKQPKVKAPKKTKEPKVKKPKEPKPPKEKKQKKPKTEKIQDSQAKQPS